VIFYARAANLKFNFKFSPGDNVFPALNNRNLYIKMILNSPAVIKPHTADVKKKKKRSYSPRLSPALREIDFVARQIECLNAKSGSAEKNKNLERAKKAIALAFMNEAASKQAWRVALESSFAARY
jgi:hypothetical protein